MTITPLILIGHSNRVPSATITGGSWTGSRDLVKTRPTGTRLIATSNTLSSTKLTLTWTRPQPMQMLVVAGHNGSRNGMMRWSAFEGSTLRHAGAWRDLKSPVASTADLSWYEYGLFTGKPGDEFYARYPSQVFEYLPATIGADRIEVEFDDQTNADLLSIGFIGVLQVWQPSVAPDWPIAISPRTVSELEVTEGDVELGVEGAPVRETRLSFTNLPEADGVRLNRIQREAGETGELWLDIDPLGQGAMTTYDRAMLCRQVQPEGVTFSEFWRAAGARLFRETF
ncbi:hypothetical protein IP70_18755 [alpha proteobacterium AAP38]|nr:hypothetical protein IP70_18755 [alpha proteobacterium AAP38]